VSKSKRRISAARLPTEPDFSVGDLVSWNSDCQDDSLRLALVVGSSLGGALVSIQMVGTAERPYSVNPADLKKVSQNEG